MLAVFTENFRVFNFQKPIQQVLSWQNTILADEGTIMLKEFKSKMALKVLYRA